MLLLFICGLLRQLHAGNPPSLEYQVKAAFLFNFTRFVDWPADAFQSEDDPLIIGIVGADPFGKYIDELVKGEKKGAHPIVVRRYHTVKEALASHILFINQPNRSTAKEDLEAAGGHHILTVSDIPGFTAAGGVVGFYRENNKVKLQINTAAAEAAALEVSSKLLSLATIFNDGRN